MTATHMAEPMATERAERGAGGPGDKLAKSKSLDHKFMANVRKLSHAHLSQLHSVISGEMERRAKEHAKAKPPGQMSDHEFSQFARRHMGQSED